MVKQIFVNMPVKDLKKSIEFFTKLGFTFNPKFTDDNATCMIIGENMYAMLLVESYFKTFTKKDIPDSFKNPGTIIALQAENRGQADDIADKAMKAGASKANDTIDYGWMYNRSFSDLDGHIWEIFYMNESEMPQQ